MTKLQLLFGVIGMKELAIFATVADFSQEIAADVALLLPASIGIILILICRIHGVRRQRNFLLREK